MMNEKWFNLSLDEIEKKLKTNAATGLSRKAARSRAQKNVGALFLLPTKSPLRIFGEIFADFSLILLLLAAGISLFFDEILNGITVLVLLLGYLAVLGILSYRSQRTMESVSAIFAPTVRVIRGGKLFFVDFRSIAVGDVILLEAGDVICCDARLVTSDGFRVRMRLDREQYRSMDKVAEGHVNPKEHRASEMVNMVHGGSVVEKGSARAIVTAVGRYTYLGAMTGGIEIPFSDELPLELKQLQKLSKKINIVFLLAVIPVTILSLLISYFRGGTILLSVAFLTALSLVATTASHLTMIFARSFYVNRIRKMAATERIAVIRSSEKASCFADADYLFLVDGALLTDGKLHFHQAICAEGQICNAKDSDASAKYFAEMVSMYRFAATRTLTTGVGVTNDFLGGIGEFIRYSGVDEGALAIRCSCLSYGAGNLLDSPEQVCISDRDHRVWLHVSRSSELLENCEYVMIRGEKRQMSARVRNHLIAAWNNAIATHQIPMIFTAFTDVSFSDSCFLGMLFFKEGVDEAWLTNKTRLQKSGCKLILFAPTKRTLPQIPMELLEQGFVSKETFLKHQKPLSYRFGKFGIYVGFEKEDIIALLGEVRSHGYRVAVGGMSEEAEKIASFSDAFVSCAPMISYTSGYLDEEIQTPELLGGGSASTSLPSVKTSADILVSRPIRGKGGLFALSQARASVQALKGNLSGFLRYLLCTQLLRLVLLTLPMLWGTRLLDARHLLLCSCVFDIFAFFSFLERRAYVSESLVYQNWKQILKTERGRIIAIGASAISVFILPWILNLFDFAGQYLYMLEFSFMAMILLHWSILLSVRFGSEKFRFGTLVRDFFFVLASIFIVAFLGLAFSWQAFGELFLLEKNPIPYFILSFVPSVIFFLLNYLLTKKKKKERSCRPE